MVRPMTLVRSWALAPMCQLRLTCENLRPEKGKPGPMWFWSSLDLGVSTVETGLHFSYNEGDGVPEHAGVLWRQLGRG